MAGLSQRKAASIKRKVGEYLLAQIESFTNGQVSPVTGRDFRALKFKYAEKKRQLVGSIDADLHLTGGMIGALSVRNTESGVELFISDQVEKLKAYNHNVGDTLPKRQFLPDDELDQTFVKSIREGVRSLIEEELGG